MVDYCLELHAISIQDA